MRASTKTLKGNSGIFRKEQKGQCGWFRMNKEVKDRTVARVWIMSHMIYTELEFYSECDGEGHLFRKALPAEGVLSKFKLYKLYKAKGQAFLSLPNTLHVYILKLIK